MLSRCELEFIDALGCQGVNCFRGLIVSAHSLQADLAELIYGVLCACGIISALTVLFVNVSGSGAAAHEL